jgi:hypothetical protein
MIGLVQNAGVRVMPNRKLRYGLFTAGLLLAGFSFLVCRGNALTLEGRRESLEKLCIAGTIVGSVIAGLAVITSAVMSRRFVPLAAVVLGGVVGALAGKSLFRLGYENGSMEWMLGLCIAPIGMWLGWLGGASRHRVVATASLGGAVGALLAALAFPNLFDREVRPLNDDFWTLIGLFMGGVVGILLGGFVGWLRSEQAQVR